MVALRGMTTPRDHHYFFAKKLIPGQVFHTTDRMFAELTGPQREAFVFFLWQEAGKAVEGQPLPHVGQVPGTHTLAKLDVVGAMKANGQEVVVISMPPALEPNEALFVAPVRGPEGPRVFFYERCRDEAGTGVHPSECVLAEVRPDGSRINHGFLKGVDLAAFKAHLGQALGISLDGLETSLPAVTAEAFLAAGGGPGRARRGGGAGGGGGGRGGGGGGKHAFDKLIAGYILLRVGVNLLSRVVPSLVYPLWPVLSPLYSIIQVVIGIGLLVWLYRVHAERRGQASFSPGMAVGGWFIPIANVILPPLILRSAWRAYHGSGGGLAFLWWVVWLIAIPVEVIHSSGAHVSVTDTGGVVDLMGTPVHVSHDVGMLLLQALSWGFYLFVLAYGLLWVIVRGVNEKR